MSPEFWALPPLLRDVFWSLNLEPLTPPDALHPLVVDHPAGLNTQQLGDLAIAVATVVPSQRDDVSVRRASSPRPCGGLRCVERCCPSAWQARRSETLSFVSDMLDAKTATCGAQKFPRAASCKMILSRVRSDTARRRRAFSVSSSLKRLI